MIINSSLAIRKGSGRKTHHENADGGGEVAELEEVFLAFA